MGGYLYGGGAPTNATYVTTVSSAALTAEGILTEGTGINITVAAGNPGTVTISSTGAAGSPLSDPQYLVLALSSALTNERRFVPGTGLTAVDGGANGNYTLSLPQTVSSAATPTFSRVTLTAPAGAGVPALALSNTLVIANLNAALLSGVAGSGYALLAGRAGTANDLTLRTDGTGILRGSAAASQGLDLVATINATDGAIRFFSDPTTERARILATGEFLLGATALSEGSEIGLFRRDQNAETLFAIENQTNDTAATTALIVTSRGPSGAGGRSAYYQAYSTAFTAVINPFDIANSAALWTNANLASGLSLVAGAGPLRFFSANTLRATFLATGELQGDAGLTIQGGAGVHTLTLVGGAGVASTLRLALVAGDLIGFHGATAVAQHSTTGQTAGFTAGAGSAVLHDSTFTGGTGATAYTIGDVVRALKLKGLMAA